MSDLKHDELAHSLARHLCSDDRMVWEDIPAGVSGSIRPDVYTINKSFTKPNPTSYEVKVSVSDFRSDITSGKWQGYKQFSHAVVFAVPKGLITKKDIPNGCGLMTFNGQFWNIIKRPTIHPASLDGDLLLKLLMAGSERQTHKSKYEPREYNEEIHNRALMKKFGDDFRRRLHYIEDYPEVKKDLIKRRKELMKILDIDGDPERWIVDRSIKRKIEDLIKLSDETERKAEIAKELVNLSARVNRDITLVINRYAK